MLRLALAYLIALAPALVLLAGLILIIEMTYHLSVKASEGPAISIFHVALDAASVAPWVVAAVLCRRRASSCSASPGRSWAPRGTMRSRMCTARSKAK